MPFFNSKVVIVTTIGTICFSVFVVIQIACITIQNAVRVLTVTKVVLMQPV